MSGLFVKDPITGNKIKSDTVYKDNNYSIIRWVQLDPDDIAFDFDLRYEFEYSKNRIIFNAITIPTIKEPTYTGMIDRIVFSGKFKYSKNGVLSGRLSGIAQGTYFFSDSYEYITANDYGNKSFGSFTQLFKKIGSDDAPVYGPGSNSIYNYDSEMSDSQIAANAVLGDVIENNKNRLDSFRLDSFYGGDWWNNPFDSNLV
jgi:hypothetical protein